MLLKLIQNLIPHAVKVLNICSDLYVLLKLLSIVRCLDMCINIFIYNMLLNIKGSLGPWKLHTPV